MSCPTVIVRTDGGGVIGFGHVRRCLTLAHELAQLGAEVQFLCDGTTNVRDVIAAQGFQSAAVDRHRDLEQTQERIQEASARTVIVDSYALGEKYLKGLRGENNLVVAIDDLALHHFPVDLLVNGAANATELRYSALPQTRFLLGPRYALLREEFARHERKFTRTIAVVLVTLGGSDACHLTLQVVKWVRTVLPSVNLDLILGPLVEDTGAVEQACKELPEVVIYNSPVRMDELMLRADVAISGGGQTCYELAATGTPTIAICMAENQRGQLAVLSRKGILLLAGNADDADLGSKLMSRVKALAEDPTLRWNMTRRGPQMVDGNGASRVANVIAELAAPISRERVWKE